MERANATVRSLDARISAVFPKWAYIYIANDECFTILSSGIFYVVIYTSPKNPIC